MAIPLLVWGLAAATAAAGGYILKKVGQKDNDIIDAKFTDISSNKNNARNYVDDYVEEFEQDHIYESLVSDIVAETDISSKEFKAIMEERAEYLRMYLKDFRNLAGWTAEELGDMRGVTRQAINNIEKKKSNLSIAQYMAITTLLYRKSIAGGFANSVIPQILYSLVENRKKYTTEQLEDIEFTFMQLADAKKFGRSAELQERMKAQLPKDFEEQVDILAKHLSRTVRKKNNSEV